MSRPVRITRSNPVLDLVRAEPKKAVAFAVLITVMGVLWARVFWSASPALRSAQAQTAAIDASAAPTATSPTGLSAASAKLSQWSKQSPAPLKRNLFAIDYDQFPADTSLSPQTAQNGFWEQLAKSMDSRADQDSVRRTLVENLQKRASKLRPKATLTVNGGRSALIDGNLVSEGDVLDGFRVLRIEASRLVVECDGIRFAILSETN